VRRRLAKLAEYSPLAATGLFCGMAAVNAALLLTGQEAPEAWIEALWIAGCVVWLVRAEVAEVRLRRCEQVIRVQRAAIAELAEHVASLTFRRKAR